MIQEEEGEMKRGEKREIEREIQTYKTANVNSITPIVVFVVNN